MSEARFWKVQIRGLNDRPLDPVCYVKAATRNKARHKAAREARDAGYFKVAYCDAAARICDPPPPGHHFYEAR